MLFTSRSSSAEPTDQAPSARKNGDSGILPPGKVLENLSNSISESITQPAVRVGKELKSMLLDPAPVKPVARPIVAPSIRAGDKPRLLGGLTVLIPAYNEGKFVADTIRSVQRQSVHIDHVIVIDDCSTDNTGEIARSCGPEIVVIRPPKNCGSKATALNYALEYVSTEYTLAIDADTTLADDAIEKLMPHFDQPRTAAVCGMVLPRFVRTMWERGRYIEYLYAFLFYKPIQDYYERPLIASGCFSAYRTDILRQLGGWNTRTVGEDMDLTWSVYRLGMSVRFAPEALCYPVEPHNYHFMSKQLQRWCAGFAQCIKVHWKDIVGTSVLRSMVATALWDAVVSVFALFILLPLLAIFVHPAFLLGYFLDLPTIVVPVLIYAAKRGEFFKALSSIPAFWVLRFVNTYFVTRAFWNEFIGKRSVTVFEKGH
ncbi:MAG: glycosyltransferase family 2 protein [Phycisphaerales bacterium]